MQINESTTQQPLFEKEDGKDKQHKAGISDYMLMLGQVILLLIWTFCTQYDKGVLPQTTKAPANSNVYSCF